MIPQCSKGMLFKAYFKEKQFPLRDGFMGSHCASRGQRIPRTLDPSAYSPTSWHSFGMFIHHNTIYNLFCFKHISPAEEAMSSYSGRTPMCLWVRILFLSWGFFYSFPEAMTSQATTLFTFPFFPHCYFLPSTTDRIGRLPIYSFFSPLSLSLLD